MTSFTSADTLRGADFREVSLAGSTFYDVSFEGASFRESSFRGARMRGVQLEDVVLDGTVDGLVINGVEVAPLVEGELDRRHPGRERLRSEDPDDLRAGWSWLEQQWAVTMAEALAAPADRLRLRVDDEWSLLETLRHLVHATDCWLGVAILGRRTYHPWGLSGPWLDPARCGLDVTADPTTDQVLEVRAGRQALVRDRLAAATRASLAVETTPWADSPWPPPEPMTELARLHVILEEEWWHLQFARRDMAAWPDDA